MEDKYRRIKKLGEGGFGTVYKVQNVNTSRIVALKEMRIDNINMKRMVQSEAILMGQCKSEFIVDVYDSFVENDKAYIVMEYCEGGPLSKIDCETITENDLKWYLAQIVLGVEYLHKRQIIHRDLKCQNILITRNGRVKIADFGISSCISANSCANTQVGAIAFMSPEMVMGKPYNKKADIWSLGKLAVQLATGNPRAILKTDDYSSDFISFVNCCLQDNPEDRYDIHQLKMHPFISDTVQKFESSTAEYKGEEREIKAYPKSVEVCPTSYGIRVNETHVGLLLKKGDQIPATSVDAVFTNSEDYETDFHPDIYEWKGELSEAIWGGGFFMIPMDRCTLFRRLNFRTPYPLPKLEQRLALQLCLAIDGSFHVICRDIHRNVILLEDNFSV